MCVAADSYIRCWWEWQDCYNTHVPQQEATGLSTSVTQPFATAVHSSGGALRVAIGIHHHHQLLILPCRYYSKVKSQIFYKYIFYFLIDVATTNAYVVFREWSGNNKAPIKEFQIQLVKEIIAGYCRRRAQRWAWNLLDQATSTQW